jgi:hypothetical protein
MFRKLILLALVASSTATVAQPLPPLPFPPLPMPQGSPEEREACSPDVHKYCERALPDVLQVAQCLQVNRTKISPSCRQVLVNHGM